MPESKLVRYVSHDQAIRMKGRLDHAIAMIRAEFEQERGVDPRGVDAELAMLLVRTAAMMGMDISEGAAEKIARLEADLARAKIDTSRASRSPTFANGTHNGTQTIAEAAVASSFASIELSPYDAALAVYESTPKEDPAASACGDYTELREFGMPPRCLACGRTRAEHTR